MTRPSTAVLWWIIVALGLAAVALYGTPVEAGTCKWMTASWYGIETCDGRPPGRGKGYCQTADGTPFDGSQLLIAHKTWKLGTKVRVSYRGRSIVVPVRDRGPYISGRSIDLSHAVAKRLRFTGVQKVCVERL